MQKTSPRNMKVDIDKTISLSASKRGSDSPIATARSNLDWGSQLPKCGKIDNPTPQFPPGRGWGCCAPMEAFSSARVIVVMVGLPASGKTFIATRLKNYLEFFHALPVKTFRVADYRREVLREREQHFDYGSPKTRQVIDESYQTCVDEALQWMLSDASGSGAESGDASTLPQGKVAIFDASNHTRTRRESH